MDSFYHLYVEDRQGNVLCEAIYAEQSTALANYDAWLEKGNISYAEVQHGDRMIVRFKN